MSASPGHLDYGPTGNAFNGQVKWVQIDVDGAARDCETTGSAPRSDSNSRWRGSRSSKKGPSSTRAMGCRGALACEVNPKQQQPAESAGAATSTPLPYRCLPSAAVAQQPDTRRR